MLVHRRQYLDFPGKSLRGVKVDTGFDDFGENSYAPAVERVLPRAAMEASRQIRAEIGGGTAG